MARFYPVSTDVDGRTYTGEWALIQGGDICVRSKWGRKPEPLGKAQPEAAAKRILEKIVRDFRRQKERDARRLAKEGERLARGGKPRNQRWKEPSP